MAYLFKFRGPVEPDREIDPGYVSELATALSAAGVYDPAKDPERKRNNGLTTGMQQWFDNWNATRVAGISAKIRSAGDRNNQHR